MAGKRLDLIFGAIVGAALVGLLTALLGALVHELAHPVVIVMFVVLGAVLGAFAWGSVAYEREHEVDEPSADYREGVLAERSAEPGEHDAEPAEREPGLTWFLRHRTQSLLRLPLTPWI